MMEPLSFLLGQSSAPSSSGAEGLDKQQQPQMESPAKEPTSSTRTLPLVLGALALVGFSSLMYTVVRKTPKEHALALSEILRKNPNTPEMHSKLAAYMFAGRAFATATGLLGTSSLVLGTGLVYAFDISSFEDFSYKLRGSMQRTFPSLKGRYSLEEELEASRVEDAESLAFLAEWEREVRAPAPPPSQMEALLQSKVRNGLPFGDVSR